MTNHDFVSGESVEGFLCLKSEKYFVSLKIFVVQILCIFEDLIQNFQKQIHINNYRSFSRFYILLFDFNTYEFFSSYKFHCPLSKTSIFHYFEIILCFFLEIFQVFPLFLDNFFAA